MHSDLTMTSLAYKGALEQIAELQRGSDTLHEALKQRVQELEDQAIYIGLFEAGPWSTGFREYLVKSQRGLSAGTREALHRLGKI